MDDKKVVILLTLIEKMEKNCKKNLKRKKVKEDPYSHGHISGELLILELIKEFIEKARKR